MRPKSHRLAPRVSAVAVCGVLAILTGCPAKLACPPCYVGGVMANSGSTNAAPKSAVHLQLDSSLSGQTVTGVTVVLTDANGTSETLTYSGDKVAGINATALTEIADAELYSVDGKPPVDAQVEFTFKSGKTTEPITISVKPEDSATTATAPAAAK
jgi:hypothetical protein